MRGKTQTSDLIHFALVWGQCVVGQEVAVGLSGGHRVGGQQGGWAWRVAGDAAPLVLLPRGMPGLPACSQRSRCPVPGDPAMELCLLGLQRPQMLESRATWPPSIHPSGKRAEAEPPSSSSGLRWDSRGGLFSKGSLLFAPRSQELHLRTEAHSYLSDLTKPSDLEFIETKRPRLDLLQDPLMRHSPLLNQSQQGGTEDLSKVRGQ